ncbi:NAD+-dependent protein deacetylase SIR2 [Microdochium nivale]|nr:NAD+-dependent protein deacetylase SIR2 [Microdochium nivale]
MAPRRPEKKAKKRSGVSRAAGGEGGAAEAQTISPSVLLKAAEHHLSEGNAADALILAKTAFDQQQEKQQATAASGSTSEQDMTLLLPSLSMLGQINLELGELVDAKTCFLKAAEIDPDGSVPEVLGGGAEKFFCLAQLSDEGGADSVGWFEKGAAALKAQIQKLEAISSTKSTTSAAAASIRRKKNGGSAPALDEADAELALLKKKLAMALCSVAEVYMTDLSWEADAEQRCESLVTEATLVAPDSAESWQTLANVRISQDRLEDARAALARSLELWRDLAPGHDDVPDFPSRVALARLLLEVEMETAAIEVLERLVGEDDHSVEVWYLGGWGLYILGEKQRQTQRAATTDMAHSKTNGKAAATAATVATPADDEEDWKTSWVSSRVWLSQSQHLYKLQEYEDDRLGEHAKELLSAIAQELGEADDEDEAADDDNDGDELWEDDEDNSDDEMKG